MNCPVCSKLGDGCKTVADASNCKYNYIILQSKINNNDNSNFNIEISRNSY